MENIEKSQNYKSGMIHFIISKSYFVFLIALFLGVFFDMFFHFNFLNFYIYELIGIILMILGTILSYWAQKSSRKAKREYKNNILENKIFNFSHGPYKYIRNPSYLGIAVVCVGFGFLINSVFSILFSLLAYFFIRIVYVSHEEKILENKHGESYISYKKNKIR